MAKGLGFIRVCSFLIGFAITANALLVLAVEEAAIQPSSIDKSDKDGSQPPDEYNSENEKSGSQEVMEDLVKSCEEAALLFESCTPATCYEVTDFGKIYKQIIGIDQDGGCHYIEKTPNIGSMKCNISKPNAATAKQLFGMSYNQRKKDIEATTQIQKFIQEFCSIVTQNDVASEANLQQENSSANSPVDGEQTAYDRRGKNLAAILGGNKNIEALTTVMFYPDEINKLHNAIFKLYGVRIGSASRTTTESVSNFYLSSILYISDNKWTVWLNNSKIETSSKSSNINIVSVSPEEVKIRWVTNSLNTIAPTWKNHATLDASGTYTVTAHNIRIIEEGKEPNWVHTLYFTLKPNQTFLLPNMSIIEGKG